MAKTAKTVLITGVNRGLGAALAATFHKNGWHVLGTARDPASLNKAHVDMAFALDLSDPQSVRSIAQAATHADRHVDFLINNAGFNPKDRKDDPDYFQSTFRIENFSAENVAESMWINALAPTELVSQLLHLLADDAVVLNISSWLGSIGEKSSGGHYGYAGSKALLNMMTRALACEWTNTSRSAVALNPGWMSTEMGGSNAKTSPEKTAVDILDLYTTGALRIANGRFLNSDGTEHAW